MSKLAEYAALAIDRDTNIVRAKQISRKALYTFRMSAFQSDSKRIYPGAKSLSLDDFDEHSLHVLYEDNRQLCGAARIVRTVGGRLPFSKHFTGETPKPGDLELSRFVTRADRSGKKAFLYLLPALAYSFINIPIIERKSRIFADVLSGYPRTLNRTTYLEFGFEPSGHKAYDDDYGLLSELFILPPENLPVFLKICRRYQERIGRVPIANTDVQDAIHNTLLTKPRGQDSDFREIYFRLMRRA